MNRIETLGTAREHEMVVEGGRVWAAIRYMVDAHGERMAVFEATAIRS